MFVASSGSPSELFGGCIGLSKFVQVNHAVSFPKRLLRREQTCFHGARRRRVPQPVGLIHQSERSDLVSLFLFSLNLGGLLLDRRLNEVVQLGFGIRSRGLGLGVAANGTRVRTDASCPERGRAELAAGGACSGF